MSPRWQGSKLDERVSRAPKAGQARSSPTLVAFEATLPAIAAQAVGIARRREHVLENAKQQSAPGLRGTEREAIVLKLADMRTRTDAARLLYMKAASMAMGASRSRPARVPWRSCSGRDGGLCDRAGGRDP